MRRPQASILVKMTKKVSFSKKRGLALGIKEHLHATEMTLKDLRETQNQLANITSQTTFCSTFPAHQQYHAQGTKLGWQKNNGVD